jgi:hypothetical protein
MSVLGKKYALDETLSKAYANTDGLETGQFLRVLAMAISSVV